MAVILTIDGPVSDGDSWNVIDWHKAVRIVNRLQARIVKAVRAQDWQRVRSLQRLLARSFAAKLLAVRRVSSNRGKKTAGVDGIKLDTPAKKWRQAGHLNKKDYRPQPLWRTYIPKKNGKLRPLSIPTQPDRAEQALELLGIDPVAECMADPHSYGFRKKRSIHDAIGATFNALRLKGSPQWILEGDIRGCFDRISHKWMLENIPMNKRKLKLWLKSGFMEKGVFHPTEEGTPQGGIASPVLANMVLDEMESILKSSFKKADKVHLVRYADDEIVTGRSKELLEDRVKPLLMNFLQERGLEFSEEKTRITHIDDGFDFLGFNIRKYHGKLLIKPSKFAVKAVKEKIRGLVMSHKTVKTDTLIGMLNPIIRGWGNNYRHVVSKKVFVQIDHAIWQATWKWARRRHPNKSPKWIKSKYYQRMGQRGWVFKERNGTKELLQMADIPIRRHIQIKAEANPYDPAWKDYLKERDGKQRKIKPWTREDRLWFEQEGRCVMCQTPLGEDEPWDVHHLVPKEEGGTDTRDNLVLLHTVCHRQVHSQYSMRDRLPGASRRLIRA